jgi:uncharacterized repeat protein (TIGR01451 family)
MREKYALLILTLVLFAPFASIAYPSLTIAQTGTLEPITYVPPSLNHTETLGVTTSLGGTVLVNHLFGNVTLETPFNSSDLSHVSLLVFSFVGGTWSWNYWSKPFWKAPIGASMKVVFQGVSAAEVSDYVQKAKALSRVFAEMYGLESTVIYLVEHQGGTLVVDLYAQCSVDSIVSLWAEALPSDGLGKLLNTSVIEEAPFKYLGISLNNPKAGTTLGAVSAIYVRPSAVSVDEGSYTLSLNNVVGYNDSIMASENSTESLIYLVFPYLANITSVTPEPTFPHIEDWETWSEYWGKTEMEPELRRETYGLCGLLVWDMGNITSTDDVVVTYDFNYTIERLTHRPVILATMTMNPPRPDLGQDVNLTISLENVGNETATPILVRPMAYPWLFATIFEAIYDDVANWGFLPNWVNRDFFRSLVSSIYSATVYISELKPGETKTITKILKFSESAPRSFFARIEAFYFPMGCTVIYGDQYHRRYMVTSNGYFTGVGTESPALIATLTMDKYLVKVGENVTLTLVIKNLGDKNVSNIYVSIFAISKLKENLATLFMERNYAIDFLSPCEWRVREMWRRFNQFDVYHETVPTIPAGGNYTITLERKVPWLGGSSSLVAAITFPFDWQSYMDPDIWSRLYSHQVIVKHLPSRLLLLSNSVNLYLVPGVVGPAEAPQPKLEVSKSFSTNNISLGSIVDVVIKVKNVGDLPANVTVRDLLPTGCTLLSVSASSGTTFNRTVSTILFKGKVYKVTVIGVRNLEVEPGQIAYLNYTLKVVGDIGGLDPPAVESASDKVIIGPAIVTYSSDQPTIDPGLAENSEVLVASNSGDINSGFSLVGYTPAGDSNLLPRSLIFMGTLGAIIAVVVLFVLVRRGH